MSDKKTTICQVLHSLNVGGAEVLAYRLAKQMSDRFRFVFACVSDAEFTADNVLSHIEKKRPLGWLERVFYRRAIYGFREAVLAQKQKTEYWNNMPANGPGRIDTFGPYKALFYDLPQGQWIGTTDFPSLWNQRPRIGMKLHWDGNNDSVDDRNMSAAIGAGVTAPASKHDSPPRRKVRRRR